MADSVPPSSDAPPPLTRGTPEQRSEPAAKAPPVPHLQLKAALLLLFTLALVTGAALYLMYARGVFEPKQQLVLITDDADGVVPGMDLTFSGFAIGSVRRVS